MLGEDNAENPHDHQRHHLQLQAEIVANARPSTSISTTAPRRNLPPIRTTTTTTTIFEPRRPKVYTGTVQDDVETWLGQVEAYLQATEAPARQQVAFAATFLADAAREWYNGWRKQRGTEPSSYQDFAAGILHRFGDRFKEMKARRQLREIHQKKKETVRSYASRFTRWLGQLTSYDEATVQDQFQAGLHLRVAELLLIKEPRTLEEMMVQAEEIELVIQQAKRTRFTAHHKQSSKESMQTEADDVCTVQDTQTSTISGKKRRSRGRGGRRGRAWRMQRRCYNCQGIGHTAAQCPSQRVPSRMSGRVQDDRRHSDGSGQECHDQTTALASSQVGKAIPGQPALLQGNA
jgi:hypothetical protein